MAQYDKALSGVDAFELVIEGIKDHFRERKMQPTKLKIPWGLAWDLYKLGHKDIGALSGRIFLIGPTPENLKTLFGFEFEIDYANEVGLIQTT
jgi:hypothetical protein